MGVVPEAAADKVVLAGVLAEEVLAGVRAVPVVVLLVLVLLPEERPLAAVVLEVLAEAAEGAAAKLAVVLVVLEGVLEEPAALRQPVAELEDLGVNQEEAAEAAALH